jgi:hypothetical protein
VTPSWARERFQTSDLPCAPNGKRSRSTATVSAWFRGFGGGFICAQLPPVETTRLHKGSIFVVRGGESGPGEGAAISRTGLVACSGWQRRITADD